MMGLFSVARRNNTGSSKLQESVSLSYEEIPHGIIDTEITKRNKGKQGATEKETATR